ncbi:uncharacterized protein Dvir_GJ27075 [Drosophila virilis]|uniref:Uncharacterized protein n=1 Tax=Drosophila virilis TaxID=7244 RepID=A0A0Q9WKC0_DROVI|nr:uncharacterized protein LOC6628417 isoform X3 [Drosophila virilis]KRF81647.1 uncharacterized protein Dvir_GJ27075 [Drosophila virilis]
MSGLNPYKHFLNFICKMSPQGRICEAYLRAEHPECFRQKSRIYVLLELPQKAWRHLFSGNRCHDVHYSHHYDYCSLHDHDSSILSCALKILIILAVSIGILYAVFKNLRYWKEYQNMKGNLIYKTSVIYSQITSSYYSR